VQREAKNQPFVFEWLFAFVFQTIISGAAVSGTSSAEISMGASRDAGLLPLHAML